MLTIQYTGRTANTRYSTSSTVRFWNRPSTPAVRGRAMGAGGASTLASSLSMGGSFGRVALAHALHPVVEDEAQQQDDEEVDEREGRRRAEVELADRLLREVLRQEGRRVAGPAAGQHERLGVDHEAVHEAQQHRDHQHAAHLRQLDVAEHRELAGPVDAGGLVVRVRNG